MSYLPAVWLVIFLVRLLVRAQQSGKGGSAATGGGGIFKTGGGANLGAANLVLILVTFSLAVPVALGLAASVESLAVDYTTQVLLSLLAFVSGFYAAFAFPHWLAWRVLGPWGVREPGGWMIACAAFTTAVARAGARELYRARFDGDWKPQGQTVCVWTISAAAIRAELLGEADRADALLNLLTAPLCRVRSWRRPGAIAVEMLAWSALRSGDFGRATWRAGRAQGRGTWLLRLLAKVESGLPVPAPRLVAAWFCGPGRKEAYPFLRAALAKRSARGARGGGAPSASRRPPRLLDPRNVGAQRAHLAFLARAATGAPLPAAELEALADSWSARLEEPGAGAGMQRRALELGAQEAWALPAELRKMLVAELEILAERVEGGWSVAAGPLASTLRKRALAYAHEEVEREVQAFANAEDPGAGSRQMASGLEELDRWLDLYRAVWQVELRGGSAALRTLWYGGLRYTACNWGVFLVRERGEEASWAAFLMHSWCAGLAARVGDEEIGRLSGGNARLTRARLG